MTQNNLGRALQALGERESGTERLEEAAAAFRRALEVLAPEVAANYHDIAQANLDRAEALIEEHLASSQ